MTADRDVLVLDADTSYPIDIFKSLSKRGLRVHAADTGADFAFSKYSRYTDSYSIIGVPEPGAYADGQDFFGGTYFDHVDAETYRAQLTETIENHDIDVLIPYREEHVIALSSMSPALCEETGVKLALPAHEDVIDGVHKRKTMQRAAETGLSIPRSYYPDTTAEVRKVFEREDGAVVAKPSFGRGARGVHICETVEEGLSAFEAIREFSEPLFQEFVTGKKYVACTVADRESTPITSFVAQVHHMSSPDGGGSICSESCQQETVKEQLLGLVDAFDWVGPATPEYIIDEQTGEAKLMEINPRMFGHTTVAIRSGVDVPYLYYRLTRNEEIDPDHQYQDGMLWMNPYAMTLTGQIREWSVRNLLKRARSGRLHQSEYPLRDPMYAGLKLWWDLKQDLVG
jgi:biotin carboxylase